MRWQNYQPGILKGRQGHENKIRCIIRMERFAHLSQLLTICQGRLIAMVPICNKKAAVSEKVLYSLKMHTIGNWKQPVVFPGLICEQRCGPLRCQWLQYLPQGTIRIFI